MGGWPGQPAAPGRTAGDCAGRDVDGRLAREPGPHGRGEGGGAGRDRGVRSQRPAAGGSPTRRAGAAVAGADTMARLLPGGGPQRPDAGSDRGPVGAAPGLLPAGGGRDLVGDLRHSPRGAGRGTGRSHHARGAPGVRPARCPGLPEPVPHREPGADRAPASDHPRRRPGRSL